MVYVKGGGGGGICLGQMFSFYLNLTGVLCCPLSTSIVILHGVQDHKSESFRIVLLAMSYTEKKGDLDKYR